MRSQEFTGKTTQEAIDAGLAALGVTIADVHVDVIQEGAKGLFGLFGSKPACVRLTVMEEEKEDDHGLGDLLSSFSLNEPRKKPAQKPAAPKPEKKPEAKKPAEKKPEVKAEVRGEAKAEVKPEAAPKAEAKAEAKPEVKAEVKAEAKPESKTETKAETAPKQPKPPREKKPRAPKAEKPAKAEKQAEPREYAPMVPAKTFSPTEPPVMHPEDTPAGRAQRFLMDVTSLMNVKVDVYVDDTAEDGLYIHMIGDTLGILIGRRGETLDALQYLTSLQVNKGREGYIRVTLDTENYRAKREDSLRRLAQRMANRAQKTGRKVVLEPMNPYERRVLHTALQNHPAVTTHSEGEEPNRRVVIMLANQPERAQAESSEKSEKGERGDKPSSSRRRRSRRGRGRGPKPAAQDSAPETMPEAVAVAEPSEAPVDVLGE
ncbi:MAG: RNA-binding cell elongation regulator Jag/EloR [Candidatus Ventricola sp.]|nr:RNA-binding cell elongation regulator Jag/EloR [Candidatus Ventricola sp.]